MNHLLVTCLYFPLEIDEVVETQRTQVVADILGLDFLELEIRPHLLADDDSPRQTQLDIDLAGDFLINVLDPTYQDTCTRVFVQLQMCLLKRKK